MPTPTISMEDPTSTLNPEELEMFVDLMEFNPTSSEDPPQQQMTSNMKRNPSTKRSSNKNNKKPKAAPRRKAPKKTKKAKPKPPKPPKKPLSAYNIYFQFERKRILNETDHTVPIVNAQVAYQVSLAYRMKPPRKHRKSHGKISFLDLSRTVARRWKLLDPNLKRFFHEQAHTEALQYQPVFEAWKRNKMQRENQAGVGEDEEGFSNSSDGPDDKDGPPSMGMTTAQPPPADNADEEEEIAAASPEEDEDFDSVIVSLEEDDEVVETSCTLLESPIKAISNKGISSSSLLQLTCPSVNKDLQLPKSLESFCLEEFPSTTTLRYCPLVAQARTQGYNIFEPIHYNSMAALLQQD